MDEYTPLLSNLLASFDYVTDDITFDGMVTKYNWVNYHPTFKDCGHHMYWDRSSNELVGTTYGVEIIRRKLPYQYKGYENITFVPTNVSNIKRCC